MMNEEEKQVIMESIKAVIGGSTDTVKGGPVTNLLEAHKDILSLEDFQGLRVYAEGINKESASLFIFHFVRDHVYPDRLAKAIQGGYSMPVEALLASDWTDKKLVTFAQVQKILGEGREEGYAGAGSGAYGLFSNAKLVEDKGVLKSLVFNSQSIDSGLLKSMFQAKAQYVSVEALKETLADVLTPENYKPGMDPIINDIITEVRTRGGEVAEYEMNLQGLKASLQQAAEEPDASIAATTAADEELKLIIKVGDQEQRIILKKSWKDAIDRGDGELLVELIKNSNCSAANLREAGAYAGYCRKIGMKNFLLNSKLFLDENSLEELRSSWLERGLVPDGSVEVEYWVSDDQIDGVEPLGATDGGSLVDFGDAA